MHMPIYLAKNKQGIDIFPCPKQRFWLKIERKGNIEKKKVHCHSIQILGDLTHRSQDHGKIYGLTLFIVLNLKCVV